MIDWLTGIYRLNHADQLQGGGVIKYKYEPNGDMRSEWEKVLPLDVEGSHSSNIQIMTAGENLVYVSGNPSKFLQGHNLFGSDDLRAIVPAFLLGICEKLGIPPSDADMQSWIDGDYDLKKVDINRMYELSNRGDVRSWLRAAELQSTSRHGRPVMTGGTVYWGKNSRRWAMKAYSKGDEIEVPKHKLPLFIPMRDELTAFADNMLRVELRLLSMILKEIGKDKGYNWSAGDALQLHQMYLEKINMNEQFNLAADHLEGLPGRLQMVYQAWKRGDDLRAVLPKRTYFRYRSELLKHGIDINVRQPSTESNVIPLIRALRPEAVASVPSWAIDTPLYFNPHKVA